MAVPGYLKDRWLRLDGPGRLPGVDLARGIAVLGMLAAHLLTTAPSWIPAELGTWDAIVNGRSSILFAVLAGVSLGLFTGGAKRHEGKRFGQDIWKIMIRAGLLYALGLLLLLPGVPVYIILPAYGILFFLALPALALSARTLLLLAAGLALVTPFLYAAVMELPIWDSTAGNTLADALGLHYPFFVWIAFVLAGLAVARANLMRTSVQLWLVLGGGAVACLGYGLSVLPAPSFLESIWTAAPHSSGLLEVFGSGGFALAVLGICLLICRVPVLRFLTLPLRATGSMPLTAYTAQILVWGALAWAWLGDPYDLFGFRALEPFWPFAIGTVIACTLWAFLVGRGPVELAIDRVTRLVKR